MAEDKNVLDEARALIEDRLKELDDERKRLERALSNLKGDRRGPGRPRGASAAAQVGLRQAPAPAPRRDQGRPRPQGGQGEPRDHRLARSPRS